jgi:uncharacterized protein YndB with AHSA1/START domain
MGINTSKIMIRASAQRVWKALTRPDLVKQWQFGTDLHTDWLIGGSIIFRNEWEGKVYTQKGSILEVDPNRLIKYTLFAPQPGLEDRPENYFVMSYLLEENDGQTILTIDQEDPRSQPAQEPDTEGENVILVALKKLVEDGAW